MSGDTMMFLIMIGIFLVMVSIMIGANWYIQKYSSKLSFFQIVLSLFLLLFIGFGFFISSLSTSEKSSIIENVYLKNKVVAITMQTRNQYFKEMKFDDGKSLPMPEEMNGILKIGDSIYKNKGDDSYTVVDAITKKRLQFKVKVHERILGKPQ